MAILSSRSVSIDLARRWPAAECTEVGREGVAREVPVASGPAPRLLDAVRNAARTRHLSRRTEKTYVAWVPTTMIYAHVLNRGPGAVRSPADRLGAAPDAEPAPQSRATRPGYTDIPSRRLIRPSSS